jgi:1,4-dihydroxy-2-naphthoyl-CoA hydrolase
MSIWQQPIDCIQLNDRGKGTLSEHLGIEFTAVKDNALIAQMPVDQRTVQPLGILNGGASCALAESVGSAAANFCVSNDHYCVGLDINANHIKPATAGNVTATAQPIHLGKRTQVWQITIEQHDKIVCICRLTCLVCTKNKSHKA